MPCPSERALCVVVPHPDDETLGCGGLIAHFRDMHRDVTVVFVTDGSGSLPAHPVLTPEKLVLQRQREATAALQHLGVTKERIHFLNYPDGGLSTLGESRRDACRENLGRFLAQVEGGLVVTPYRRDRHPDHEACFQLVRETLVERRLRLRHLEFPLWRLWQLTAEDAVELQEHGLRQLDISPRLAAKRRALAEHVSQVEPVPPWTRATLAKRLIDRLCAETEFYLESP